MAQDQNIRPRSGWFSDRSATYSAAGKPAVTQDTGFGNVPPTGRGAFAFRTMEDIFAALEPSAGITRAAGRNGRGCRSMGGTQSWRR